MKSYLYYIIKFFLCFHSLVSESESFCFYVLPEVEPISTYLDFGEREFLVADERGYEFLLYKMAADFLFTSEGKILDSRLKLNKVHYYKYLPFCK